MIFAMVLSWNFLQSAVWLRKQNHGLVDVAEVDPAERRKWACLCIPFGRENVYRALLKDTD
jgi:hypothetical protein